MEGTTQLKTIKEASLWASDYLSRDITESNIFHLMDGDVKI